MSPQQEMIVSVSRQDIHVNVVNIREIPNIQVTTLLIFIKLTNINTLLYFNEYIYHTRLNLSCILNIVILMRGELSNEYFKYEIFSIPA